jgi:hypothetical protein
MEEIKQLLWHQEIEDEDIVDFIKEADKKGDQLICLEEFIHAVLKLNEKSL